ncbi:transmembrane protein [Alcanivorax xiamenensis]|uniref:Transmembrane protein n=1 Tax=Alcanivorax xiamenensis TaxID=1177156 RepID=A0ABQ6Y7I0_9GAMM|nr:MULTISPECIES: hypothetical protein [Alcanivorax]KAF0805138.1 transmembrane protein [Alcanivorax xiamenensis]
MAKTFREELVTLGKTLKGIVLVIVVFALFWGGTILFWRIRNTDPGVGEAVGWLLLAPLVVLVLLWAVARWRSNRRAAANDKADTPAESPERPDAEQTSLNLLAAALRLPAGETPEEALQGLMTPQAPKLHGTLRDAQGLPLFAAPLPLLTAASLDAVTSELNRLAGMTLPVEESARRSLALLLPVFDELLMELAAVLPEQEGPTDERVIAGLRHRSSPMRPTPVLVSVTLPAASPSLVPLCEKMMRGRIEDLGLAVGLNWRFQFEDTRTGTAFWRRLARPDREEQWQLWLAADSLIDPARMQTLQKRGALMTSRTPEGVIPGEGVAGVLLGTGQTGTARMSCRGPYEVTCQGAESAQTRARKLAEALRPEQAADHPRPGLLISNADYRAGSFEEAALLALSLNPELDASRQLLALGRTGALEGATPAVMLALVWQALREGHESVAVLFVDEERGRQVAVFSAARAQQNQTKPSLTAAAEPE